MPRLQLGNQQCSLQLKQAGCIKPESWFCSVHKTKSKHSPMLTETLNVESLSMRVKQNDLSNFCPNILAARTNSTRFN